jgi:CRISP-associated protein Cas1
MQLFINTYGTYVHVKDEMFEVRVPVEKEPGNYNRHHFAAKKVSSILMPKSAALSTDAIILALKYNVDIVFVDFDGQPLGRVWHSKLGSTTRIRKMQLHASLNSTGLKWVKDWLVTKMQNQADFIRELKKHRSAMNEYLDDKIKRIEALIVSLSLLDEENTAAVADTIRGLEGTSGRLYFETISHVLPEIYRFDGRSSRPAKDAYNAFLNYAYGMLYGKIEKTLIIAGIDPYLGFLHRDDYNQLSMVYDFIEPYRIFSDTVVFRLFTARRVRNTHTDAITNGFTLNKEGKELLVYHINKYFDVDTIRYKGRNQTRSNAIQMDAHAFANNLISKEDSKNKTITEKL